MDYFADRKIMRATKIDDGVLRFSKATASGIDASEQREAAE
jgi:hypothetical protein